MRALRVLAVGLLLVAGVIGLGIWYAVEHENELVNLILAQIATRTGLQVKTSRIRFGLGTHFVIELEATRLTIHSQEAARIRVLRAVFSYWNLLKRRGLPLYTLVLDGGTINLSLSPLGRAHIQSPVVQLQTLSRYLDTLGDFTRRFDLIDLTLIGPDSKALADQVNGEAYRQHYGHGTWPWILTLSARLRPFSVAGTRVSGQLEIGHLDDSKLLAQGQARFWQLPLPHIRLAGCDAWARLDGDLNLALSADAQVTGQFRIVTKDLIVEGATPERASFDNFWSRGVYYLSQSRAEVSSVQLYYGNTPILQGHAEISNPFNPARTILFSASGINLRLTDTARWLHSMPRFPTRLLRIAERIKSGTLVVKEVGLKAPQPLVGLRLEKLWSNLQVAASLDDLSYVPAPETQLPPIYRFDAQCNYSNTVARISRASGQVGATSISDILAEVNLSRAPGIISYRLRLMSWLDVGEAYQVARALLHQSLWKIQRRLLWVQGHSRLQLQASGTVEHLNLRAPRDYLVTADMGEVQFELKKMPTALWLSSGSITIAPARILLTKVMAIPLDQPGNAVISGAILWQLSPAARSPDSQATAAHLSDIQLHNLTLEIHQMVADKWVPIFVNPDQLSVLGSIDGNLTLNGSTTGEWPIVVGKLVLDEGTVQPGFLRNPMILRQPATLVLDGRGLAFELPAASLEGDPLHLRMVIADLNHPRVRIDATIARIDFEVMRFIRLPWSPSSPPVSFPLPVSGHIEARAGNFDKLAMTAISTDFYHDRQVWHVTNFHALAFNGSIALNILGRARDDWINLKGSVAHMDAGPLFLLSGSTDEPPIMGKLAAVGDLWADTNSDFFSTMTGTLSITMTDGTLNRFTLVKRILSLVNLKNYLTAQFPDPRKVGIPFKTLDADFRGAHGVFYTDNLRLNGPVMDITARGNINLADNTIDMEIDLLALQTVNWLLNNIPFIGKHLGKATKHLVGAYFQVRGPIDHPAIWPKPLASVAEFVFRTLTLPINIVVPNTIQ
jgi:hypothetical protein